MNLRKLARGRPCMIRMPGVCNGNPETTVLCHLRMVGITGMGIKASDFMGAWGCSDCHRYVDTHGMDGRTALLEGMARTQAYLLNTEMVEVRRVGKGADVTMADAEPVRRPDPLLSEADMTP